MHSALSEKTAVKKAAISDKNSKKAVKKRTVTAPGVSYFSFAGAMGLTDEITQLHDSLPIAVKQNKTGMSIPVKEKYEAKFGLPLDDVRVEYHSDKPREMDAVACAKGADIFISDGSDEHLEHELCHVIQQMRGEVEPTDVIGGNLVNRSPALEREASAMKNIGTAPTLRSLAAESNTYQLFSVAVEGSTIGKPHFEGSTMRIERRKTAGWILLRKANKALMENDIAPLSEDITVAEFLNNVVEHLNLMSKFSAEINNLRQGAVVGSINTDSRLSDVGEPAAVTDEDSMDVGADGYKNTVLNILGKLIHKILTDEKFICGPHIALSYVAKTLYVAINTPNTSQRGKMISETDLISIVMDIILNSPPDTLTKYGNLGEYDRFIYFQQIRKAVVQGRIAVITADDLPPLDKEHLGTIHAEMLIAEYLKSTQNPIETQIATHALTPEGGVDTMQPILTAVEMDNRRQKHPDTAKRVIRFGGTLCDCKLCHAKFHGGGQLKSGRGSLMHYKGSRADSIGTDTYDNALGKFGNVILSSEKDGNWHPGWQNGPLAMEHKNHTEKENKERYLARKRLTTAALERELAVLRDVQPSIDENMIAENERVAERIGALEKLTSTEKLMESLRDEFGRNDFRGMVNTVERLLPIMDERVDIGFVIFAVQKIFEEDEEFDNLIRLTSSLVNSNLPMAFWLDFFKAGIDKVTDHGLFDEDVCFEDFHRVLKLFSFILGEPSLAGECGGELGDIAKAAQEFVEANKPDTIQGCTELIYLIGDILKQFDTEYEAVFKGYFDAAITEVLAYMHSAEQEEISNDDALSCIDAIGSLLDENCLISSEAMIESAGIIDLLIGRVLGGDASKELAAAMMALTGVTRQFEKLSSEPLLNQEELSAFYLFMLTEALPLLKFEDIISLIDTLSSSKLLENDDFYLIMLEVQNQTIEMALENSDIGGVLKILDILGKSAFGSICFTADSEDIRATICRYFVNAYSKISEANDFDYMLTLLELFFSGNTLNALSSGGEFFGACAPVMIESFNRIAEYCVSDSNTQMIMRMAVILVKANATSTALVAQFIEWVKDSLSCMFQMYIDFLGEAFDSFSVSYLFTSIEFFNNAIILAELLPDGAEMTAALYAWQEKSFMQIIAKAVGDDDSVENTAMLLHFIAFKLDGTELAKLKESAVGGVCEAVNRNSQKLFNANISTEIELIRLSFTAPIYDFFGNSLDSFLDALIENTIKKLTSEENNQVHGIKLYSILVSPGARSSMPVVIDAIAVLKDYCDLQ